MTDSTSKDRKSIRTIYDPPPIPTANFDWRAMVDFYDEGGKVGYGQTEQAAIDDLLEQLND